MLSFFMSSSIIIYSPLRVIEGGEGVDNYILLGLNRKEVKIMKVKEEKGIMMVELVSKMSKM